MLYWIVHTHWKTAAVVCRSERVPFDAWANRTDRALRTHTARRCAENAHTFAQRLSARDLILERDIVLYALSSRPGWSRTTDDHVAYAFGRRRTVIAVPAQITPEDLASIVARTEIRVLLGDASLEMIAHLQTFAARELQRLFAHA